MTTTSIDYQAAFTELATLNKLFEHHGSNTPPHLDPSLFTFIKTEQTSSDVVVLGVKSGLHYLSTRSALMLGDGTTTRYTPFRLVAPVERTIIEWKYVSV